jgi:hypothetical protein
MHHFLPSAAPALSFGDTERSAQLTDLLSDGELKRFVPATSFGKMYVVIESSKSRQSSGTAHACVQ